MILGYWDFRGLGEPARLILSYVGDQFEDRRYSEKKAEEWMADKESLGLDFPNLPYLIDGEVKVTESGAIYKYLGKKYGLLPSSDSDSRYCDMIEGIANDLRLRMSLLGYLGPGIVQRMDETKSFCSDKIGKIDRYLSGRKYVAGEMLTYVDFVLYEFLDRQEILFSDILEDNPNVRQYLARFRALEPIRKYLASDGYKRFPIHGINAHWGGKPYDDRSW